MTTKQEIIRDTIEYYCDTKDDRFSYDPQHGCMYRAGNRRCALARYIPDDLYCPSFEGRGAQHIVAILGERLPFSYDVSFWELLQEIHDSAAAGGTPLAERKLRARARWEAML